MTNELRLGNIIGQGVIDGIFAANVFIYGKPYLFDELEPIKLTEEFLFKFGFRKQMGCMFTNKITIRNSIKDKYELRVSDGLDFMIVKHVHQLQNIYFSLTGEELTLKTE